MAGALFAEVVEGGAALGSGRRTRRGAWLASRAHYRPPPPVCGTRQRARPSSPEPGTPGTLQCRGTAFIDPQSVTSSTGGANSRCRRGSTASRSGRCLPVPRPVPESQRKVIPREVETSLAEQVVCAASGDAIRCRVEDSARLLEIDRGNPGDSIGRPIGEGQGFESPQLHPTRRSRHGRPSRSGRTSMAAQHSFRTHPGVRWRRPARVPRRGRERLVVPVPRVAAEALRRRLATIPLGRARSRRACGP